jgi:hypothetical protein
MIVFGPVKFNGRPDLGGYVPLSPGFLLGPGILDNPFLVFVVIKGH